MRPGLCIGALALATACATPQARPVRIVPCLDRAPPLSPSREIALAGGEGSGCPPEWEACLDLEAALRLERYVRDLRRWSLHAWLQCGPPPGDAPTYGVDGGCGSMYMITTWPPSGGPRAGRRPH